MASQTGGVKPFPIEGRMSRERERLTGMTDEDRAWRKQWLKDQVLTSREPVYDVEVHPDLMNPIRRVYRFPLDKIFGALTPALGKDRAMKARWWTGKVFICVFSAYAAVYYFKYNTNDWTRRGGWRVISSRPTVYPGDPGFPAKSDRSLPSDYADRKFKSSVI